MNAAARDRRPESPTMKTGISRIASTAILAAMLFLCVPSRSLAQTPADPANSGTFTNPLLPSGADPWVLTWNGDYYYMNTTGRNLTLWKTHDITDLRDAEKKIIWTPEPDTAWSKGVWAPEIHRWGDKWYVYFAADADTNDSHRIYVLENSAVDPLQGQWTLKGKVTDASDNWAIDPDIFEINRTHYMVWSGWKGANNGEQEIYIARMSNPWTIDSPRTMISSPTYPWEKIGDTPKRHIDVNEGPEALVHGGNVFVFFSASGCWTDSYEVGAVEASARANLLDPASWKKFNHPFFQQDPKASVYATGHNGFFKSLDGKQDWIIYHANGAPGEGCGASRSPRIQPFTWGPDGTPNFGSPVAAGQRLQKPGS